MPLVTRRSILDIPQPQCWNHPYLTGYPSGGGSQSRVDAPEWPYSRRASLPTGSRPRAQQMGV